MTVAMIKPVVVAGRFGGYEGKIKVSYTDCWKWGSYLVASGIDRLTVDDARRDAEQLQAEYRPVSR